MYLQRVQGVGLCLTGLQFVTKLSRAGGVRKLPVLLADAGEVLAVALLNWVLTTGCSGCRAGC